jgi:hypothetical protein
MKVYFLLLYFTMPYSSQVTQMGPFFIHEECTVAQERVIAAFGKNWVNGICVEQTK